MPRLLAAQAPTTLAQLSKHVAIAYVGRRDFDVGRLHRRMEAVIGHHSDDNAVARQTVVGPEVNRRQRDQLIAINACPEPIGSQDAIAIAVESKAEVVPVGNDSGSKRLDVGRADTVVDIAAVWRAADRCDGSPEPAEDLRADAIGRSVGAVEQQIEPRQVEVFEAHLKRPQVVLLRAVELANAADRERRSVRCFEPRLNLLFGGVRQLQSVSTEKLDPVVLIGVVRRRDNNPEVEPVLTDQQGRRGCRQHAAEQRFSAGCRDTSSERRFKHFAGFARVA
ncbi:unannotated protein [freshwater metagenome]|uniref:Unannotated protein n=1 Tax=freshwater metagenome TaxID=449393 RepID=A0A6J5ZHV6_9ZZZZ